MKHQGAVGRMGRPEGGARAPRNVRHAAGIRLSAYAALLAAALFTGCATQPGSASGQKADLSATLEEAAAARKQGQIPQALKLLNDATAAHPGDKTPWLQIAQIHFDQSNYGAAIVAAQEVVQRDNADTVARSIMAVSGLRVSADALAHLRQANAVSGSTRTEAESVAKIIRDAVGEPVLVPPTPAPAKPVPVRRTRPVVKAPTAGDTLPAAPSAALPAAPARPAVPAAKTAAPRNPLDALK
ncbi:MAG: hypothetical protein HZB72_11650 [Burkholderiales bacterium]|nr:hypothetical protein [Burkholderiales bacterium]